VGKNILLSFISIFVAVDAVGVLPMFVSLTTDMKRQERNKTIIQSMLTALIVAVGFIFLGKAIFRVLGITIADFMIAGGAILFCLASSRHTADRRSGGPDYLYRFNITVRTFAYARFSSCKHSSCRHNISFVFGSDEGAWRSRFQGAVQGNEPVISCHSRDAD